MADPFSFLLLYKVILMQSKRTIIGLLAAGAAVFSLGVISGVSASPVFSDVQPGSWEYNSVIWASANGLMTGPGDMPGMFDPNGTVNRAQLATVMERYDQLLQTQMTGFDNRLRVLEGSSASSVSSRSSSSLSNSSSSVSETIYYYSSSSSSSMSSLSSASSLSSSSSSMSSSSSSL